MYPAGNCYKDFKSCSRKFQKTSKQFVYNILPKIALVMKFNIIHLTTLLNHQVPNTIEASGSTIYHLYVYHLAQLCSKVKGARTKVFLDGGQIQNLKNRTYNMKN